MTKDHMESVKIKTPTKKRQGTGAPKSFDAFLKKQIEIVASLKAQLHDSIADKQQMNSSIIEKNNCMLELQKSIADRDNEIKKLSSELSSAREENVKTLQDFYTFKEKFFELEAHYDGVCQLKNREVDNLKHQLEMLQSKENERLNELTSSYQDLKQEFHERNQAFSRLNLDYAELMRTSDKNRQDFERQQKDFENYQKQVEVEKNAYDAKMNQDLAMLKNELLYKEEQFSHELAQLKDDLCEKDGIIRQCLKDKQNLEEEKNRHIEELNYKIKQIEKVFGQPTKMISPMVVIPNTPEAPEQIQNTAEERSNLVANVAVTRPQIRRESLETSTDNNNNNNGGGCQYPETAMRSRVKKIPRPPQANSVNASNVSKSHGVNRKRGFTNNRNPSPPSGNDEFSTPSSDEDDDDIFPVWNPNKIPDHHYVPETETDASESFSTSKRSKK